MEEYRLSVIIPAFNEHRRIGDTLDSVQAYLGNQSYRSEVIVVNDGSADDTAVMIEQHRRHRDFHVITNEHNYGKGYSVKRGLLAAKGRFLVFTDADNSTPIEEIAKFWPYFEQGYEVIIGSRALRTSEIVIHQARYRELMGKTFNIFVQLVALRGIKDTQCGFKAFTNHAAHVIFPRQTINRWGFDPEILFIARKHHLPIAEVPIRWTNSPDSRINSFRDSYTMFRELLSIRYKDLLGLYR